MGNSSHQYSFPSSTINLFILAAGYDAEEAVHCQILLDLTIAELGGA
jgi:hypothetical protein